MIFLADCFVKSLFVLLVAAVAARLMRNRPAASRHLLWVGAFVVIVALPIVALVIPGRTLPVFPSQPAAPAPTFSVAPASEDPIVRHAFENTEKAPKTSRISPLDETPIPEKQVLAVAPPPSRSLNVPLLFWASGCAVIGFYWMIGYATARRILCQAEPLEVPELAERTRLLRNRRTHPPFPLTMGVFRPSILLPAISRNWPERRVRSVLMHELGHVHRLDWLTQTLAYWACAAYWFNPMAWYAARRLRAEAEIASDDYVLSLGASPIEYADDLLQVAGSLSRRPHFFPIPGVPAMKTSKIENRIQSILTRNRNHRGATGLELVLTTTVATVLLVPLVAFRAGFARSPNQDSSPTIAVKSENVVPKTEVRKMEASQPVHNQHQAKKKKSLARDKVREEYMRAYAELCGEYAAAHHGKHLVAINSEEMLKIGELAKQKDDQIAALKAKLKAEQEASGNQDPGRAKALQEALRNQKLALAEMARADSAMNHDQAIAEQDVRAKVLAEAADRARMEENVRRKQVDEVRLQDVLAKEQAVNADQLYRQGAVDAATRDKVLMEARELYVQAQDRRELSAKDAEKRAVQNLGDRAAAGQQIDELARNLAAVNVASGQSNGESDRLKVAIDALSGQHSTENLDPTFAKAVVEREVALVNEAKSKLARAKKMSRQGSANHNEIGVAEVNVQIAQLKVMVAKLQLQRALLQAGKGK